MKVNDLTPYLPIATPPSTGSAGNVFTDPVFNTPILRVTDENDSSGDMFANAYSAIYDMFNLDASHFLYVGLRGSNWVADLDIKNKKVSNKRNLTKGGAYYWSRVDPNILYVVSGWSESKIWKYDLTADKYTLVVDLSTLLTPLPVNTTWTGTRGMSWDDNRFQITYLGDNSNYIYDVKKSKLIGPFTLAQAQATAWKPDPNSIVYLFTKCTMDSAGEICYTADNNFVFNPETGDSFVNGFGTPDNQYGDVHADCGFNNVLVSCGGVAKPGPDDGLYPVVMNLDPKKLSTYLTPRRIIGPRFMWGLDSHTSYRDATGQFVTFDLDGAPFGNDVGRPHIFDQEIFQFNINSPADGSLNQRIAHHYSDSGQFTDAGQKYWASPHASGAPLNKVVGYNSTYGNKRIDIYIAFLDDVITPLEFTQDEKRKLKEFAKMLN